VRKVLVSERLSGVLEDGEYDNLESGFNPHRGPDQVPVARPMYQFENAVKFGN
jgi:hypothetical protein